ncbi:uncharacterized protein [Spinacia oleracea]|uniref:DUF4283 domain-containing protein n=1 Tax=Spinacia oleracea TaxID=3562 RepID=A0ABM3QZR0_SPIOL|nr:uncharacterized protein LOC130463681 [Spinacia oleracea]
MDLVALGKGFYALHGISQEIRCHILADGPWFVMGAHLWAQNWEPSFRPSEAKIDTGPVWVTLPELPLEFYEKSMLEDIGQQLGTVVKIDTHTLKGEARRFANICVLISKENTPARGIWLGKSYQKIQYSSGVWFCKHCNQFGHAHDTCPLGIPPTTTAHKVSQTNEDGRTGVWKVISKRGKEIRANPEKQENMLNKKWAPKETVQPPPTGKETHGESKEILSTVHEEFVPGEHIFNPFSILGSLESSDSEDEELPSPTPKRTRTPPPFAETTLYHCHHLTYTLEYLVIQG